MALLDALQRRVKPHKVREDEEEVDEVYQQGSDISEGDNNGPAQSVEDDSSQNSQSQDGSAV